MSPSHPPYPSPLGGHKALSWSPCAMQLLPTSYLFYIWYCIYVNATLSLRPSLPLPPPRVLKPILYVCLYSCPACLRNTVYTCILFCKLNQKYFSFNRFIFIYEWYVWSQPCHNNFHKTCYFLAILDLEKNFKDSKGGFPGGAVVENLPANAGDTGSNPGLGRSHMPRSN